jgi:hypothetical protein
LRVFRTAFQVSEDRTSTLFQYFTSQITKDIHNPLPTAEELKEAQDKLEEERRAFEEEKRAFAENQSSPPLPVETASNFAASNPV